MKGRLKEINWGWDRIVILYFETERGVLEFETSQPTLPTIGQEVVLHMNDGGQIISISW